VKEPRNAGEIISNVASVTVTVWDALFPKPTGSGQPPRGYMCCNCCLVCAPRVCNVYGAGHFEGSHTEVVITACLRPVGLRPVVDTLYADTCVTHV
jgi:hypothetical protein